MHFMDEPQAYLNGRFLPATSAALSLTDAGFVLGAAVAEQVRTFAGKLFRLDDHLARLKQSLETIGIDPGATREEISGIAEELVSRNHRLLEPGDDLGLSIFVTPGPYAAYASPSAAAHPTVCLHTYLLPFRLWARKYRAGQALVTTDVEQVSPKSWPASLKCRSRMHYYLADRQAAAIEPGARALMLDSDGRVVEASTANVMIFNDGEGLVAPPAAGVLPGISMTHVAELAHSLGLPSSRRELWVDDIANADEVLLTSTPFCLLSVTRFNGRPIGDGAPGETFQKLLAAWSGTVNVDLVAQAERFAERAT